MLKRVSFYTIGMLVACLGIALIIFSAVGAGPWDAVFVGLNMNFGLTVGMWAIIAQVVLVLFNAVLLKRRPEYESAITIILRGVLLDFWLEFVFKDVTFVNSGFVTQWGVFLLGTILLGIGVGVYVVSQFPKTPVDATMMALNERFGWSLKTSRTIIEITAVVIAFAIGGPVGIGTVVLSLILGHFVQVCHKWSKELYDRI